MEVVEIANKFSFIACDVCSYVGNLFLPLFFSLFQLPEEFFNFFTPSGDFPSCRLIKIIYRITKFMEHLFCATRFNGFSCSCILCLKVFRCLAMMFWKEIGEFITAIMTINYSNIYDIHNYVSQFSFYIIECVPEDICLPSEKI